LASAKDPLFSDRLARSAQVICLKSDGCNQEKTGFRALFLDSWFSFDCLRPVHRPSLVSRPPHSLNSRNSWFEDFHPSPLLCANDGKRTRGESGHGIAFVAEVGLDASGFVEERERAGESRGENAGRLFA
jgi:hypothetical protein